MSQENYQGVAKSPVIKKVLADALNYSKVNRPILVRGERGTGKELLAKFIHNNSARKDKPFITINCAAFTEQLLTSELYGHEKGAFTGADKSKIGKLEQADGGTLFMDEIGNMSSMFQQMILRVIEYQEFEKVRGLEKIKVDVRIISATNADLEDMMQENLFLPDLYDRLTFAELTLPSLRRRREEIPHLVIHFVKQLHNEIPNLQQKSFQKETIIKMMEYHWPGNTRELKNITERLYLGPTDETIVSEDLPPEVRGELRNKSGTKPNQGTIGSDQAQAHTLTQSDEAPSQPSFNESPDFYKSTNDQPHQSFDILIEHYKKELILKSLKHCHGRQKDAAKILQMSYDQFRHYYKKYNLKKNDFTL